MVRKSNSVFILGRIFCLTLGALSFSVIVDAGANTRVNLKAGSYLPFFKDQKGALVEVKKFALDKYLVTNGQYLNFLKAHPKWRKSKIARVFAEAAYLKNWKSDLVLESINDFSRPVTQVSWFAAEAYCESKGGSLPSNDQWEYASDDAGRDGDSIQKRILDWYAEPGIKKTGKVGLSAPNGYGIYDLHGLVWEWTIDFNSVFNGAETRSDGTKDENLFCGSASLNAMDPSDYAKFMRYSMRSSLKADFTTSNLGFRCAYSSEI